MTSSGPPDLLISNPWAKLVGTKLYQGPSLYCGVKKKSYLGDKWSMDVFSERNYRQIIKELFELKPNFGHGQASKLARHLDVNTTLISQVLSGKRELTEEQAVKTAEYLGLNSKERYYFLLLVQCERATTSELKDILNDQILNLQREAKAVKGRVSVTKELTFPQQATYYSAWLNAAIHSILAIPELKQSEDIAQKLGLNQQQVVKAIDTLVGLGLIEKYQGSIRVSNASTYLPPDSPLVAIHHQNWRQQAAQKMHSNNPRNLFFTAPMSIAKNDFKEFREVLAKIISDLYKKVENSKPENLACLNIDFFEY